MSYKNHSLMYDRRDLPNSYYEKFTLTGEIKCIDDEIPFDLPKDWEWCRIKDISRSYIGLTYKPEDISSTGTIVLRSSNIREGKIVLEDVVKVSKSMPDNLLVEPNDIIICARNGSKKLVGKSALVTEISETTTFGAFMAICKTPLYQYVYCFLQSELFFSQLSDVSGTTTINQLTQNNFNQFLIPIPPLVEQERIIAKIEELMPLVERYGKAQSELEALNNNIREQLKKSVLQYAIEGKLVPQYEEDGTAEDLLQEIQAEKQRLYAEGKLKKKDLAHSTIFRGEDNKYYEQIGSEIMDVSDEIPFDLPCSWQWVRFGQIVRMSIGKTPARGDVRYWSNATKPWVSISDMVNCGHINNTKEKISNAAASSLMGCISPVGSLLMSFKLTVGKTSILNIDAYHNEAIITIYPFIDDESALRDYLFYILPILSNTGDSKDAIKGKTLNSKSLNSLLIPLPSLKEQRHIINRLEELYAYL